MSRLSPEISLKPLLKVKGNLQWVTEIPAGLHIHSSFEKGRTLTLGSSNCSFQGNRSTYPMLLNYHHFLPVPPSALEVTGTLQLHHHYHISPLEVPLVQLHHYHFTPVSPGSLEVALRLHYLSPLKVPLVQPHHYHSTPIAPVALRRSLYYRVKPMIPGLGVYTGTPSKFPWSNDEKTCRGFFLRTFYYVASWAPSLSLVHVDYFVSIIWSRGFRGLFNLIHILSTAIFIHHV